MNSTDAIETPFIVLVDSLEKHPFSFTGLTTDADKGHKPIAVRTEYRYLGIGQGDYTIDVCQGMVAVERKSKEDLYGTLLGFKTRRDRFERELANLEAMDRAVIVVESTLGDCLLSPPDYGVKPPDIQAKILFRSVISLQLKFPKVQWMFCDSRSLAEVATFRYLEKFYKYYTKSLKALALDEGE